MYQPEPYDGPLTAAELAQHNAHLAGSIYQPPTITPCSTITRVWRKVRPPLEWIFGGLLIVAFFAFGLPYLAASDWFGN